MTTKNKTKAKSKTKSKTKSINNLTKVGVLFDDLMMSQKTWLFLENANRFVDNINHDCVAFIKNMSSPCIKPNFSVMFCHEMWHFDGYLIATDLDSAEQISKIVSPAKKMFYVWDLEWLRRHNNKDYVRNVDIYRNPELKLVVRSESHANELSKYCNRKVDGIVNNFNLERLIDLWTQN